MTAPWTPTRHAEALARCARWRVLDEACEATFAANAALSREQDAIAEQMLADLPDALAEIERLGAIVAVQRDVLAVEAANADRLTGEVLAAQRERDYYRAEAATLRAGGWTCRCPPFADCTHAADVPRCEACGMERDARRSCDSCAELIAALNESAAYRTLADRTREALVACGDRHRAEVAALRAELADLRARAAAGGVLP